MTSVGTRSRDIFWPSLLCFISGAFVFQFLGSSTRGYIGSASLFYWWGFQWFDPMSETQHGLLILAISAWLMVRGIRSQSAGGESDANAAPGAMAMVGGLFVHLVGFVAEQPRVSILGLLLFAWGLAAFSGGAKWSRAVAFPLAFMVFAIPLNALDSAGFWLRMWVVAASAWISHGLGIGILVNGTQVLSPDGRYNYDVASACSGVRSLVALAALSLLIGYLRFRSRWLWAVMFAACFPLVYLGNVARIVSIVVAAQLGGQVWGDRVHEVMGFGVFAIVLGGAFCAAELVARLRPDWAREDSAPVPEGAPLPAGAAVRTGGGVEAALAGSVLRFLRLNRDRGSARARFASSRECAHGDYARAGRIGSH